MEAEVLRLRERFDIADPTNYQGKQYRYHVGYMTTTRRWFGERTQTFHSAIILINIEIQTEEDIEYLKKKLLEIHGRKTKKLIVLAYNRLVD